jgi:hypothetical protein
VHASDGSRSLLPGFQQLAIGSNATTILTTDNPRVALVAGASTGIGRVTANAPQDAGFLEVRTLGIRVVGVEPGINRTSFEENITRPAPFTRRARNSSSVTPQTGMAFQVRRASRTSSPRVSMSAMGQQQTSPIKHVDVRSPLESRRHSGARSKSASGQFRKLRVGPRKVVVNTVHSPIALEPRRKFI